MEEGLKPVFDKNTRIIIMGTLPSIKSRNQCYYNHPQNQFWKIIAQICNDETVVNASREIRYACLLKNRIGLWDVIKGCEFEEKSSLDAKIIKESIIYNDFSLLKKECPNLKCIVFSSENARKLYQRYLKQTEKYPKLKDKSYIDWLDMMTNNAQNVLPSTSPANARIKPDIKQKEWIKFLSKYIYL